MHDHPRFVAHYILPCENYRSIPLILAPDKYALILAPYIKRRKNRHHVHYQISFFEGYVE